MFWLKLKSSSTETSTSQFASREATIRRNKTFSHRGARDKKAKLEKGFYALIAIHRRHKQRKLSMKQVQELIVS